MTRLIRSVRKLGYHNIKGYVLTKDPGFDIDGMPSPFSVYFPILVHNGHTATIWVGAVLVSPPAGWSDSEQQLGSVAAGANLYTEKTNSTRTTPGAGTSETITLRVKYYTDAGYSVLLGFDDFAITIYWESIAAGTVIDTDDFEVDLEGWSLVNEVGVGTVSRTSAKSVHGVYSIITGYSSGPTDAVFYLTKTVAVPSCSRAYLFGFVQGEYSAYLGPALEIITPVETQFFPVCAPNVWRRFGARLNPNASNAVRLRTKLRSVAYDNFWFDYLRWVTY